MLDASEIDDQYFNLLSTCFNELLETQILSEEIKDQNRIWRVKSKDKVYAIIAGSKIHSNTKYAEPTILLAWGENPLPFSIVCGREFAYFDLKFHLRSKNLEGFASLLDERLKAHGLEMHGFQNLSNPRSIVWYIQIMKRRMAALLRHAREERRPALLILFVGPIAGGKTTQRLLSSKFFTESGKRRITLTFPPFSFFTYALASAIKRFVAISHPVSAISKNHNIHPFDFLNEQVPTLFGRILIHLSIVDAIQEIAFLIIARVAASLGYCILVEDFLPTIRLDHKLFVESYLGRKRSVGSKKLYNFLNLIVYRFIPARTICIIFSASASTRLRRSMIRGYRIVDIGSSHDINRELNLETMCRSMFEETFTLNTENLSIAEVHQKVLDYLTPLGAAD